MVSVSVLEGMIITHRSKVGGTPLLLSNSKAGTSTLRPLGTHTHSSTRIMNTIMGGITAGGTLLGEIGGRGRGRGWVSGIERGREIGRGIKGGVIEVMGGGEGDTDVGLVVLLGIEEGAGDEVREGTSTRWGRGGVIIINVEGRYSFLPLFLRPFVFSFPNVFFPFPSEQYLES